MDGWARDWTERIRAFVRLLIWLCFGIVTLTVGAFTAWFVVRITIHGAGWLNRSLFSEPW